MKKTVLCAMVIYGLANGLQAQTANPLTIPDTLSGQVINLELAPSNVQFLPGTITQTYGINEPYLAPTVILYKGQTVQMNVTNSLSDTSTMHWHGLHVPAMDDGGPHTPIAPGTTWSPDFTVLDEAATFWYHPHLHEHTTEQVYKGAAGMIIVRDSFEATLGLPHTYGVDDFPLIIQDKSFDSLSNAFIYEALSDTMMINGTLNPYLQVPAQMVRFRLLNASNQRVYNLGFPPNNIAFQISSDGGLLEEPLPITRILIAPGERAEVVVNFTNQTANFPLMANNSEMGDGISGGPQGPGGGPGNPLDGSNFPIMDFRIGPQTPNPITTLPANFRTYDLPDIQNVDVVRTKVFTVDSSGFPFYINGALFDHDAVNDTVRLGDTEIWELINATDVAHPFHIHDVQFHVIEKNGMPAPAHLRGRKDVVLLQPGDTIKFITRFDDFADEMTPYMYHCHNLFHEDGGMMSSFVVRDSVLGGHGEETDGFCSELTFFPNPTAGLLKLDDQNPDPCRVVSIEVWDLQGRKLGDVPINAGSRTQEIDLQDQVAGMYLLHFRHKAGGHSVRRIVKQ
ncbi:MAG TPA: multicopper oxidase domain-containing protein [Bacteroidia bacterium]|nr:multicopper oxidase domain-containing protein [Bacteroidia bacterium]